MKRIDSSEDATVDMEKSITPFVSGGPASMEKESLMSKHYTKQGHVICGCCCDVSSSKLNDFIEHLLVFPAQSNSLMPASAYSLPFHHFIRVGETG